MVCLDLSDQSQFVGGVVNLLGDVVARALRPRRNRTGDRAATLVVELAGDLRALTTRPVLGIGIGSPGVVFPDGVVQESTNLAWHGLPLAATVNEAHGLPTHVLNDANAAVLGELQFGQLEAANLLLVKVGLGVGAGLVLDGHLVEGDSSAAGEIGHVVVDPDGEPCACGNRGCLETVIAAPFLRRRLAAAADPAEVRGAAGRRLGDALAPVISTLNIREIVLSGPADLLDAAFIGAALETVRDRTMPAVGDNVEVRSSALGEDDVHLGAARLVLDRELGVV
jgi:predicted NBD/HSP70 family sugar kinase